MNFGMDALAPLAKVLRSQSISMAVDGLHSAVDAGLLKLVPADGQATSEEFNAWTARLRDFSAFSANCVKVPRQSASPDIAPATFHVVALPATDEFKTWFAEAALVLATEWPKAIAATSSMVGKAQGVAAITRWMACACMLDMPDAFRTIYNIRPRSLSATMSVVDLMNDTRIIFDGEGENLEVSPVWIAWQFSSKKCLDAIASVSQMLEPDVTIGYSRSPGVGGYSGLSHGLTATTGFEGKDFKWLCESTTFERLARVCLRSTLLPKAVDNAALAALPIKNVSHGGSAYGPQRVESFLAAGVYARRPNESALSACRAGFPSVVDAVAHAIAPNPLESRPLYEALAEHVVGKDRRDEAVLQLVLQVKDRFGLDAARRLFLAPDHENPQQPTLVVHLFDKNLDKMLVALMNAGIVELHVAAPGRNTPMEIAMGMNTPMVSVMASWAARRTAHALIDGMDEPTPRTAP